MLMVRTGTPEVLPRLLFFFCALDYERRLAQNRA